MKKGLSVKTTVAIGIGIAVFVVLGRFASLPSGIPNTNIQTNYAFLALFSVIFGPVAGALAGFIGHTLLDSMMWGSVWFSWVIPSGLVGLGFGLAGKKIKVELGKFGFSEVLWFNGIQAVVQLLAWFVVAPVLNILMYEQPVNLSFTQGAVAGASNIVTVGILGTALLSAYAKTRTQQGSLTVEEEAVTNVKKKEIA